MVKASVEKCDDCRSKKQKCLPVSRVWDEDGIQQKCENCKKGNRQCSANGKKRQAEVHASQINGSITRGCSRMKGSQESSSPGTGHQSLELRQSLKDALKDLDAEEEYARELQHTLLELGKRQDQLREDDSYKILAVHGQLAALQKSTPLDRLAKLGTVELLADKIVESGENTEAAERAYLRALAAYRSLEFCASSPHRKLLMKVALFYFRNDEPLQGERHLCEVFQLLDNPASVEVDVWRQLSASLPSSSNELSRMVQSKDLGRQIAADIHTPFPPLHRMMRKEFTSGAPAEFFKQGQYQERDITCSPPIHSAITAGAESAFSMVAHCPEDELEGRDAFERTPLFLSALFKEEIIGQAIMTRFKLHPSSVRTRVLNSKDYLGQTILSVAILGSCSLAFIQLLIDSGAEINPDALMESTYTPIQAAALLGRLDVVVLLRNYGASSDLTYLEEDTATQLAQKGGHRDVVDQLGLNFPTG